MKIQVSKLEANPYRKISKYKYDKKKLKALRISIKETTFWDNILVRPHPTKKGFYQIAYGHHRWKVLLNLKQKYIDVPVRKLTNAYMLKIMANENLEQWKLTPSIANETIEQARNFLTDILNKYKTWNDIRMVEEDRAILNVNNGQTFAAIKKAKKVGHDTIKHFLGDNWPIR